MHIAYAFFFLMLFAPAMYPALKGALLALSVLAVIGRLALNRRAYRVHSSIMTRTFLTVGGGLAFCAYGAYNSAPGAVRVLTVYALWPALFVLLLGALLQWRQFAGLTLTMLVALIAISCYALAYYLNSIGVLPASLFVELDQRQSIGLYDGVTELSMTSVSSLLFLLPFFAAALLTHSAYRFPAPRPVLLVAVAIGLVAALLAGRRALWMVLGAAPVITWFFFNFDRASRQYSLRRTCALVLSGVGLVLVCALGFYLFISRAGREFDVAAAVEKVSDGVTLVGGGKIADSEYERAEQLGALIEGWWRSPLIGQGLGAAAAVVRSSEQPWAYELTYVALLFHTGLVGVALYGLSVLWIYWRGVAIIREGGRLAGLMVPTLVGLTCFLLGNATNPYLTKFDFMWVIFFPVSVINYWLVERPAATVAATDGAAP